MIVLVTRGLFRCAMSLTRSPPFHFFVYVSTQFGCTIRSVQCDNEREFGNSSRNFSLSRCRALDVVSLHIPIKRQDQTHKLHPATYLLNLLSSKACLPTRYWAESLHPATYLLNLLPSKAISAPSPHFALFGTTPSYAHLRVFECVCYPNTSTTTPHKLPPPRFLSMCLPWVLLRAQGVAVSRSHHELPVGPSTCRLP
jgi:hypothetical protein